MKDRVWERLQEDATDPQRYPAAMVTEFLNDGLRLANARLQYRVTTTTVAQRAHVLSYRLPSDCVRVLGVTWGTDSRPLYAATWRELDEGMYRINGNIPTPYVPSARARWTRSTSVRSTHYLVWNHDELWLWPISGEAADLVRISRSTIMEEEFEGDGSTTVFTLANSPAQQAVSVGGLRVVENATPTQAWEYSLSGTTLTFGVAPIDGARIQVMYDTGIGDAIIDETVVASTLANTPRSGAEVAVYVGGVRLRYRTVTTGLTAGQYHCTDAGVITFGVAPGASTVRADYPLAADQAHIFNEFPTQVSSVQYTLTQRVAETSDVAVYLGGIRMQRTSSAPAAWQYTFDGQIITFGTRIKNQVVVVDYARSTEASANSYTVTYAQDRAAQLVADTDTTGMEWDFDEALVSYSVGRCLLINAREQRVAAAVAKILEYESMLDRQMDRVASGGVMSRTHYARLGI